MQAGDIPKECIEEPRFIRVLAASLCSEIAETKIVFNETNKEIQGLKALVVKGWEERKILKQSIEDMSQQKRVLNAALDSLMRETKNRSIEIKIVKNRLDDATLCEMEKWDKFKKILQNYRDTWKKYKDEYEKLPLAVKREECSVEVKRAKVQHLIIEYKMKDLQKMIQQREKIFSLQIKATIVEFAKMVLQRWKDDEYLKSLQSKRTELEEQLNAYSQQLSVVQREIEMKKQAEHEDAVKMPPPKLHFPFMCSIIYPNANEKAASQHNQSGNFLSDDLDTASVNTLMLEEMCAEDEYEGNENSEELVQVLAKKRKCNSPSTTIQKLDASFQTVEDSWYSKKRTKSIALVVDQSTDEIRDELESLDIEKRNIARYKKESSKQPDTPKGNQYKKNDENNGKNNNGDIQQDYILQKTTNKIEEKMRIVRNDFKSPDVSRSGIISESIEKEKGEQTIHHGSRYHNNEVQKVRTRGEESDENIGLMIQSVNEKEMSNERYKEGQERQKHSGKMAQPGTPESPSALAHHTKNHNSEVEVLKRRRPISSPPSSIKPSMSRNAFEFPLMTNDTENNDSTVRETPKIRRIDTVDYSDAFLKSVQKLPPQGDPKTPVRRNQPPPSPASYMPSFISSENLSNIADWSKMSRGIFPEEITMGTDFQTFQNWENWSPSRQLSDVSYSQSSFISKSRHNDSPEKRKELGSQRAMTEEKPDDSSGINMFFKTTTQKPRTSFL
ncbi:uncharacterized protein [Venturia canescens]|uniref:uncharacterized protein n=1 Tax=Venturia canescens TaxID=32260 RepID=UPI001C9CE3F0|nr:uncharacterized protein LOC122413869 [Venturia canescens]